MAHFTNKRTSTQRGIGYAFIPLCLAYLLWLIWPVRSLISFWVGIGSIDFGFDWSIFWKMYLAAYPIGFVLLLGIKTLAGGRISLTWGRFSLDGIVWTVFLYPIYVIREMYTFLTCDTAFIEALLSFLRAILKGGVLYLICAFPGAILYRRVTFADWFEDVPLMLIFAGIILLIWLLDRLWCWDNKGHVGAILANALYYVAVLGAIALTVYGCMTEFGDLYLDDYLSLQAQVLPICLPLSLLAFYAFADKDNFFFMHILPLLGGVAVSFLGAYLLTLTKVLFFVMLAIPLGYIVFILIKAKGAPFGDDQAAAERSRRIRAEADARFGSIWGDSRGGSSGTNAPVNRNLPEDSGCEKLRSQLKGMHRYPINYSNYGIEFTCRVSLSTCSHGRVVWSVSTTVTKRTLDRSDPNSWQKKQWQEDYLKEKKEELRRTLTSDARSAIESLANHYSTYGGSWSISVNI